MELGFSSDLGVTNSRYPEEICEGQLQMQDGSMMGLTYDQLDISAEEMEDVDLYMQGLGVPARRDVDDPTVKRGEEMFYQAKCHLCHTVTLHTHPRGSTLLLGTQLTWLGSQTIHPYSDFLLHDMGSEIMGVGLNDNYVSGLARGNEWRTTPLWGIGLQEKVNGHTYFLHDGRARNFTEAILWHGGEGKPRKPVQTDEERRPCGTHPIPAILITRRRKPLDRTSIKQRKKQKTMKNICDDPIGDSPSGRHGTI